MKSSTNYFHMKTKILQDFQIYISVPLMWNLPPIIFIWIAKILTDFQICISVPLNNIIVNLCRRRSGVIIVDLEHISLPCSSAFIVDFEQINVSWVGGKSMKQSYEIEEKMGRTKKLWYLLLRNFRLLWPNFFF